MADETITKADMDKAIKDAVAAAKSEWDADKETEVAGLKKKNQELLNKVRAAGDITPEELARVEGERDKAIADAADLRKQVGTLTKERDGAVKALETEQTAARTYALEAELAGAIAEGNVVPALVPALKAMVQQQAKADLVDGKYAVLVGDKSARDYMKAFLDSDEGKHFKAAPVNGGGGAPGSGGSNTTARTMTRAEYDGLDLSAQRAAGLAAAKGEVVIQDAV